MSSDELHAVLGASGGTGSAIVEELLRRGRRVRAVSRGGSVPDGAEGFGADVSTPEGAKAACAGAAVVYHAAQPAYIRWPEEFPPLTGAVIEGSASAGAKLVFADNLYIYGPGSPQPLTERTPQRATGRKGATRILMANRLMEAHREDRVRVAIGRSSDYYGPGGVGTIAGETVFGAALASRTVRWPGSLDMPHQFNYLPDMAHALVVLVRRERGGRRGGLPPARGRAHHGPPLPGSRLRGDREAGEV